MFWKVTEYLPEAKPRADIQTPSKTFRVVAKISAIHLWAITYIFQNKMLQCNIEILLLLAVEYFHIRLLIKDNIKLIFYYYRAYICHQPEVVGRWQNIGPRRSRGPIFITCPQLRAGGKNICPVIMNNKQYCQFAFYFIWYSAFFLQIQCFQACGWIWKNPLSLTG